MVKKTVYFVCSIS